MENTLQIQMQAIDEYFKNNKNITWKLVDKPEDKINELCLPLIIIRNIDQLVTLLSQVHQIGSTIHNRGCIIPNIDKIAENTDLSSEKYLILCGIKK